MRNFAQLPFKVLTTRNVFLGNWGSPSKPLRPCLLFHIPDSHQSILSRFRGSDGWEILRWDGILISPWWKPQCCSRKLWLILTLQGKSPVGAALLFFFSGNHHSNSFHVDMSQNCQNWVTHGVKKMGIHPKVEKQSYLGCFSKLIFAKNHRSQEEIAQFLG